MHELKFYRKIVLYIGLYCYGCAYPLEASAQNLPLQRPLAEVQTDTASVQRYLAIAQEYLEKDRDSVLFYQQKALDVAYSTEGYQLAYGGIKQLARWSVQTTGDFELHQQSFEQLLAFSQRIKQDSLHAISLYGLAVGHHTLGAHRAALEQLEQLTQLLQGANLSAQQVATILLLRAELHNALQEHPLAIQYYGEVLELSARHELFDKKASSLHGLKQLHQDQGNIPQALRYAQEGMEASLATKQLPRIAYAHLDLGTIYFENQSNSTQDGRDYLALAKQQFEAALEKGKESQYMPVVGLAYFNLAIWYQEQSDLEQAADYLQQALMLFEQLQDKGNGLRATMQFAKLSRQLAERLEITNTVANQAHLQQVVQYGSKAYEESRRLGVMDVQLDAGQLLASTQAELGDFKAAYHYLEAYHTMSDSLLDAEKIQIIEETEARFQNEKKELQIKLLEEENATRQVWLYSTAIGLLLALLLVVIFVRLFQQKQKVNAQLAAKNELIGEQKDLLQQRHEEKELLLKEIHHRVKNNLQVISSLLELQNKNIKDAAASLVVEDGQSRIRSMALIHQKLYQNENLRTVNWHSYTDQLIQQVLSAMPQTPFHYTLAINPIIELDIDTAIPLGLIMNELLTNACKYAFTGSGEGTLQVGLQQVGEGTYCLQVQDNGPGLPAGFELSKARSLGLRLVRRLSKQLFGKARYVYNNGSEFSIEFKDSTTRKSIA